VISPPIYEYILEQNTWKWVPDFAKLLMMASQMQCKAVVNADGAVPGLDGDANPVLYYFDIPRNDGELAFKYIPLEYKQI
jgi:hypothetical protein